MNSLRSNHTRTDNGPSLLMDFAIISPHGTQKLLFKKNDNDSIGLTLKKFFLRPFMRMQARQHIVSMFEAKLSGFEEAKEFVKSVKQNNGWGKGVNAGKVQEIIAHAALQGFNLRTEIASSDITFNNIVKEYLDVRGNLKKELTRLLDKHKISESGLEELMDYEEHPNKRLSIPDNNKILKLMSNIEIMKGKEGLQLPAVFFEKIGAVFDSYNARHDVALIAAKANRFEIKDDGSDGNFKEIVDFMSVDKNKKTLYGRKKADLGFTK